MQKITNAAPASCVTLQNVRVDGLTVSGAILVDSNGQGYRIEVGEQGVERLAHLCGLHLKDRSIPREMAGSSEKQGT